MTVILIAVPPLAIWIPIAASEYITALRIEKAFGMSMDMLLRMQAWYDASQIRAKSAEIEVER